jgi:hypothetical protein
LAARSSSTSPANNKNQNTLFFNIVGEQQEPEQYSVNTDRQIPANSVSNTAVYTLHSGAKFRVFDKS